MYQTYVSASKPGPSNQAVNLDPPHPRPRPTSHSAVAMEVDYGPALPPCLGADQPHDNASDRPSSLSDEPTKLASARPKKHSHTHRKHDTEPRSAGLHLLDLKKHADRSKHKVRSRYVSLSSEECQSFAPRHRSSKPSGTHSEPQHDPDQSCF